MIVENLMLNLGDTVFMFVPQSALESDLPRSLTAGSAQCRQSRGTFTMVFMNEALALTIAWREAAKRIPTNKTR
jgi:hypothetical protein